MPCLDGLGVRNPRGVFLCQVRYLDHVYPQEQYIYLYNCLNSALLDGLS